MAEDKEENKHLWDQFIRLGERIGDGDLGTDEKWISREYKKLSKILVPEIKEAEEMQEKKRIEQEKEWEIPAFLRKVKFKG